MKQTKKIIISILLSLSVGIMVSEKPIAHAAETDEKNNVTQTVNDGLTSNKDGDCSLKLSDGVLTIGPGKLADSGEDNNIASYVTDPTTITKIIIEPGTIAPEDSSYLFTGFENLVTIDGGQNLNTSNVTNMDSMFYKLENLQSVDVSKFDTSNVTGSDGDLNSGGMHYMFAFDSSIQNLDVSKWDVSKVRVFVGQFARMTNLKTIDMTNWVSGSLSNSAANMFTDDMELEKVGLGKIGGLLDSDSVFNGSDGSSNNIKEIVLGPGATFSSSMGIEYDKFNKSLPTGDNKIGTVKIDSTNRNYTNNTSDIVRLVNVTDKQIVVTEIMRYKQDGAEKTKVLADKIIVDKDNSTLSEKVPSIDGYTSDEENVTFQIPTKPDTDANNVIYSTETVNYKKKSTTPVKPNKPSNSGSSSSSGSSRNPIKKVDQLIAVYPDKNGAQVYSDALSLVPGKVLPKGSLWRSDEENTQGKVIYYRVGTNEWIGNNSSYSYEDQDLVIETKNKVQRLTTAEGKMVTNRALAPKTDWKIDRLANINGKSYYRVATNEFVPADEVIVK
ncbi:hypothetical protein LCR01_04380 [Companilactobacillus crustorum]|nr:BspA family leucine-rich repeat surface protein [Companilactobacillus crustorum]WDT65729.1 BspA family leucine-rich repeat surface protein [Companilactobacillus crustorum]GEO75995.1 hypothetical protein LCR01_04380 [Companilactobacillus crustorum]